MAIEVAMQRALFQRLKGLGYPVHDVAPQVKDGGKPSDFPYIEIGAIVPAKWDTSREVGFDIAMRIHVRSRTTSMLETKEIQGRIWAALHRQQFSIDGFSLILCDRETTTCERTSEGAMHGVCTYRCLVAAA